MSGPNAKPPLQCPKNQLEKDTVDAGIEPQGYICSRGGNGVQKNVSWRVVLAP